MTGVMERLGWECKQIIMKVSLFLNIINFTPLKKVKLEHRVKNKYTLIEMIPGAICPEI